LLLLAKAGRDQAAYMVVSVRSVEVAQQLRLDVARVRSGGGAAANSEIARDLALAAELVQSREEDEIIRRLRFAVREVQEEAASSPGGSGFAIAAAEADRAAEELVAVNVLQAHQAEREVEDDTRRWERRATLAAAALALGVVFVLLWVRARVLKPLQILRDRIHGVALGGAPPPTAADAPLEVREVAATFDTMAAAVDRQRHQRLELLAHVAASVAPSLDRIAQLVDGLEPKHAGKASILARELLRVRRLLDEYVDAARIDEGILDLERSRIDLVATVQEAIDVFRSLFPSHAFELTFADDGYVPIMGDASRLRQVVNNLLFIAVRDSALGGLIKARQTAQGATVLLGIEAVAASSGSFERLFNSVHGLDRTFLGIPGSGFTIHTTRRVLQAHGGDLEVHHRLNGGVAFIVSLPSIAAGATSRELPTISYHSDG
jgi:two-component system sensor histidine kinase MtrB